ncbi:hypothetical protein [Streptomyces sp. NPDC058964]|uniref:hypothetical protein n=1 Tax=Streptomyces sp. NPDC058964 TaxID=3346681 RepID=UPI0036ABCAC0
MLTPQEWLREHRPGTDRTTWPGLLLIPGSALLRSGVSVANTMVMAAPDQLRDPTALRPAGATCGQALRLVAAEAPTVIASGALLGLLGLLVAGLDLLRLQSAPSVPRVPGHRPGHRSGACALLAVTASVGATALALRHPRA